MTDDEIVALYNAGILAPVELLYVGPPLGPVEHEWDTDDD